jgi:hypothetical protein
MQGSRRRPRPTWNAGQFALARRAADAFSLLTLGAAGLLSCDDSFSSKPPPLTPEAFAPSVLSSPALSPNPADAGTSTSQGSFHMMTISRCSASSQPCVQSDGDASTNASYRVVFGSGRATIRWRGQVTTDLYNELRDRITFGEEVDVELHPSGDGGAPAGLGGSSSAQSDNESLAHCAFRLVDLVDDLGEITLDVVHEFGSSGCRVWLGRSGADTNASQCLIKEPERSRSPSSRKGGVQF